MGIKGDNYDRYYVRMCEMDESIYMIRQCVRHAARRPDQRRRSAAARCPRRSSSTREIESLINHFKLVMEGIGVPAGEIYAAHEAPNGELGFYLVSDGGGTPYKLHVRSPSFVHMGGMHTLLEGYQVADIVPDVRVDEHDRRGVRPMRSDRAIAEAPDPGRVRPAARALSAADERSLVLPLLQIVQEEKGHVTAADARFVADYPGVPPIQVEEVLSWYTMLHRQPIGRHIVKVCRNISCSLRGAERLLAHLEKKLGIAPGQTRPRTGASRSSRSSAWPRAAPRR